MSFDEIVEKLDGVRRRGDGVIARCPAHDDHNPSLSVARGRDGDTVLHCHAECSTEAVTRALGLELRDLFASPGGGRNGRPEIVSTYDYFDEQGLLLFQVVRLFPKSFRHRRPDGRGGWGWRLNGVRRILSAARDP